jgi:hypothetical protein
MSIWNVVGSLSALGTFLAAAVGTPIAIYSLLRARLEQKTEFLADHFKEYRSPEMGRAIADLWKLHRDNDENVDLMINSYVC